MTARAKDSTKVPVESSYPNAVCAVPKPIANPKTQHQRWMVADDLMGILLVITSMFISQFSKKRVAPPHKSKGGLCMRAVRDVES